PGGRAEVPGLSPGEAGGPGGPGRPSRRPHGAALHRAEHSARGVPEYRRGLLPAGGPRPGAAVGDDRPGTHQLLAWLRWGGHRRPCPALSAIRVLVVTISAEARSIPLR